MGESRHLGGMLLTVQACVRYISHCVFDRPDDAVHEQLELRWREGEERYELIS